MQRTSHLVSACRCAVVALMVALASPGLADLQELNDLDYLVGHLSLVNLVNGLNLTRTQAARLGQLARRMDAVAVKPPDLRGRLSPQAERIRSAYLELRDVVAAGKDVPRELEAKVLEARAMQAKLTRASLREKPLGAGYGCATCHAPLGEAMAKPMGYDGPYKQQSDLAHWLGDYGPEGLKLVAELSPEVEAILTDSQKAIFNNFACCLVPPSDLSDPMRAGQADSLTKELDLLRRVRKISANRWPAGRAEILAGVDVVTEMVSPGASEQAREANRATVAGAMDKARAMSETDFELDKEKLARTIKATNQPPQANTPHRAAYFLLFPGATQVYEAYLRR